jgi:Cof subfamily protein (haloacid dehalogenase superfamily)
MENLPVRLIAIDMDGTLLDEDCHLPEENIKALREAAQAGIRLAIVSGRIPEDISYFMSDAGFEDCFVLGLNGGYWLSKPHGENIHAQYMADEALEACIRVLEAERVTYSAFGRSHIAISRPFATGQELENWGSHLKRKGNLLYTYGMEGIMQQRALGTNKIVYIDREDEARLARIREQIERIPGVEVTSSWINNIEIMPSGVHKGAALAMLAQRLHIDASQVMAIGDNDNDIPMLSWAGYGVAMGNATLGARTAAEFETDDNQNAGVAKAIRRFALTDHGSHA